MMTSDQLLSERLQQWFDRTSQTNHGKRRRFVSNPVGRVIRSSLESTGNWKNAPRGNPQKAYQAVTQQHQDQQ